MNTQKTWHGEWKELYLSCDWFAAFFFWVEAVKGIEDIEELELDSDEGELLMSEYGQDKEIAELMRECWQVMGIE